MAKETGSGLSHEERPSGKPALELLDRAVISNPNPKARQLQLAQPSD
jgi:hypothetical protein